VPADGNGKSGFDLVLVADCIYNPSLIPALISTVNHVAAMSSGEPTPVLVVVELRSEDVLREFLENWLSSGFWQVWRVGGEVGPLGMPYVAWVGWRTEENFGTGESCV
jgi:hypothetical protein